jgi:hypothetical protein
MTLDQGLLKICLKINFCCKSSNIDIADKKLHTFLTQNIKKVIVVVYETVLIFCSGRNSIFHLLRFYKKSIFYV